MLGSPRYARWLAAAIVLVVLGLMTFIIIRHWEELINFSWQIDPRLLALTFLFHSLALGATYVAWHLLITHFGGFDDLKMNFRFYYVSTLAKRVPTPIWYVGGRLFMYREAGVMSSVVLNCILLENVLVGVGGLIAFLAFLPFYSALPSIELLPLAAVGLLGITGLLARPQALVEITNWILRRFDKQELETVLNRKHVVLWEGLYVLPWLFAGLSLYCATHALSSNVELRVVDAMGVSTLSMLLALLSMILPGGLGLKELTSSALLANWMPFPSAVVLSLAYRLIQTLNEVLWALASLLISTPPGGNR